MQIRHAIGAALTAAVLLAAPAFAQKDDPFAAVEIATTDLGHGIYMLTGRGGNMGVSVGEDGVILIDDQFAPLSARIKAAIAAVTDRPVRFLINTHWHGDHTGGNENFSKTGTVIISQENVRKRLASGGRIQGINAVIKPVTGGALPIITFTDEMTFYLNGLEAQVIHVPHAHTDGDSLIVFKGADVIHMGDTLFNGIYPRIDLNSGGNIEGMIKAEDLVLNIAGPKTRIIPGHGPLADKAALKCARDMLIEVRDRVAKAISQGKSLEELQGSGLLADLSKDFGGGFISEDQMIGYAYQSLKQD